MRRVFLILMIFLLPLRGMVGDAMAVQMMIPIISGVSVAGNSLQKAVASAEKANALGIEKPSAMPCHEVADSQSDTTEHDACASCEVCHLSACVTTVLPPSVAQSAEAKPASPVVQSISTTLILINKPPVL